MTVNSRRFWFPQRSQKCDIIPRQNEERSKSEICRSDSPWEFRAAFPKSPDQATLETFPNRNRNRDYWIRIDCPEFTSLCPVTGQPHFAEIVIQYVPDALCVETKSLKLYLSSYRNVPAFNERVVNRILDDPAKATHPRKMKIEGKFVPRGGLALSVNVEHPNQPQT